MAYGSIFKDKDRLLPNFPIEKYWSTLPHRSKQVEMLWSIYGNVIEKKGESFLRVTQIIGPAGTGKTCTLRFFGDSFEREARSHGVDVKHLYVNLRLEGGRRVILYRSLLEKVDPNLVSTSLSAEEMLRNLVEYLQARRKRILLTIDEVDYYVRHFKDEGIIYDLTRLNELTLDRPCGVVGATFLARDKKFHDLLDVAELSTLGRSYVPFPAYTSTQVAEILEKRVEEALHPGACPIDVIEFIADVTARPPVNGDMRYALDLLLYSGTLAENQGSGEIRPEHVRRVISETYPVITTEDILSLPDTEKLILLAAVRALRRRGSPYVPLREIRDMVAVVHEEYGFKPVEEVEEYVQDLSDRGIIDIKSLSQIGISGVTTEDLDRFLNNIHERVKSGLHEARA